MANRLPLDLLKDYYKELSNFSVYERMRIYNLREDRADVILPALQIYINVMRWADPSKRFMYLKSALRWPVAYTL